MSVIDRSTVPLSIRLMSLPANQGRSIGGGRVIGRHTGWREGTLDGEVDVSLRNGISYRLWITVISVLFSTRIHRNCSTGNKANNRLLKCRGIKARNKSVFDQPTVPLTVPLVTEVERWAYTWTRADFRWLPVESRWDPRRNRWWKGNGRLEKSQLSIDEYEYSIELQIDKIVMKAMVYREVIVAEGIG